jgi:hypothetical protein
MSTRPLLVCGPCLRYVDRRSAVVWVEVAEAMEVEVTCVPDGAGIVVPLNARSFTVQIEDGHYAWLALDWLVADTWYRYEVIGHRADGSTVALWPDALRPGWRCRASSAPCRRGHSMTSGWRSVRAAKAWIPPT